MRLELMISTVMAQESYMAEAVDGKPEHEMVVKPRPSQWTSEPETEHALPLHVAAKREIKRLAWLCGQVLGLTAVGGSQSGKTVYLFSLAIFTSAIFTVHPILTNATLR